MGTFRGRIRYRKRRSQPHICFLEVRKSGTLIGHVGRGERGFFQYYRGAENFVMYELEHADLQQLKRLIASIENPSP